MKRRESSFWKYYPECCCWTKATMCKATYFYTSFDSHQYLLPINCIEGSSIPVYTPADNLTLADLVPDLAEEHAPFYTYKGSQTTPPCYETVQWIVMKNHVTVTKDQVMQTNFSINWICYLSCLDSIISCELSWSRNSRVDSLCYRRVKSKKCSQTIRAFPWVINITYRLG